MRRPSLLILNQYFPPDTSATAKMLGRVVEALSPHFQTTVLSGRPSYDPQESPGRYLHRRENRDDFTIERVGSTAFPRARMWGRAANYLSFLLMAAIRAACLKPDAVLAMTDPPIVNVLAALLKRFKGVPFIYNVRDLHPDMALASGMVRRNALVRGWERVHRWALRQADHVIVLGEDMRQRILAKGVPEERVSIVRDGADISAALAEKSHPISQEIRSGFKKVLLHAGNLGFYGAWDTLLRAAELLEKEAIGLVFVGGGAAADRLKKRAAGIHNVRFLPFYPESELRYVMAAADVHVVTVRSGIEGLVVPSKLYGILAAGRPVLLVASEASDAARIISTYGCGTVADPSSPGSVAAEARRLFADEERLSEMEQAARRAAERLDQVRELATFAARVAQTLNWPLLYQPPKGAEK